MARQKASAVSAARYRIAIVGCGRMGARFHAPGFAAQPDCEVVACVSRTLDKAEALARTLGGGATAYRDVPNMLDAARPDVVVIATPDAAHLGTLALALERGLHVFVEKPLQATHGQERVTWDDYESAARLMLEHWDRGRSVFGMNYNYRAMPHLRRLRADVADGALGPVRLVEALAHLNCWSHTIDLLRWTAGDVAEVYARWDWASGSRERPDEGLDRVVSLRFANGAVGTLTGAAFNLRDDLIRLEVYGSQARGTVLGLNGSYRRRAERPDEPDTEWPRRDFLNDNFGPSFRATIDAYCEALRAGRQPPVDGDDGLAELAIEAAIERSARTNQPVVVPHPPSRG